MKLAKFENTFYGDQTRWFVGIVTNNNDPLRLGRVQVRIFGVHDDLQKVANNMLPWAQVLVPSTEGGVSGIGFKPNIQTGATVFGLFWDGRQSQLPVVFGTIPKVQTPNAGHTNVMTNPNACGPNQSSGGAGSFPTAGEVDLVGGETAEKIFNFFISRGMTAEQAAGIMGNLEIESRLDPAAYNPNDLGKPSAGLAQWRGDRFKQLRDFASQKGTDWKNLSVQLQFIEHELATKPYLGAAALRSSNTVEQATRTFMLKFERPAGTQTDSVPSEQQRISAAKQYYEQFK